MPIVIQPYRAEHEAAVQEFNLRLRQSPGLDPDNVMLVFKETLWENWSFAGGRFIHV